VIRETKEELSIDLDNKNNFLWIGRMPDRSFGPEKTLFPHVFLYLNNTKLDIVLNPVEAEDIKWVNIDRFFEKSTSDLDILKIQVIDHIPCSESVKSIINVLLTSMQCQNVYFSGVRVGEQSTTSAATESSSWMIWGMTFNSLCQILYVGNNFQYVIPLNKLDSPFKVDNILVNVFLKFFTYALNAKYNNHSEKECVKGIFNYRRSNASFRVILGCTAVSVISVYVMVGAIVYYSYSIIRPF
jgi:hypothetical protein